MATIHVLPVAVQNKIAAGEVIERPASVVKELVENAMDAGARHIAVDLEDGGHRLIRVSDNGHGMNEDDLIACIQRHATSKIRDVDDIFRIDSFGFRGEALPSIAGISRLTIATCTPGAAEGHDLTVDAGRILRIRPGSPGAGTRIEVRDIFFNTPARRKFLKLPASENTRVAEILTRIAIANPGIGYRFQAGDRLVLAVQPADNQLSRLRDLFGDTLAGALVPFAGEMESGLSVDGFFARPPVSRRNSKDIFVFVNRRPIKYFALARVIADAFQGALPPREYPFAIVNLTVDPARVDVNAHPTKEEVRFENEGLLLAGVKRIIRTALAGVASVPTVATLASSAPLPGEAAADPAAARVFSAQGRAVAAPPPALPSRPHGDVAGVDFSAARERLRGPAATPPPGAPVSREASEPEVREAPPPPPQESPLQRQGGLALGAGAGFRVLGQAGGRYILVDSPDGVLLVDPHALHERWNFDRLAEDRRRGVAGARLLIPLELRLSPAEAAAAGDAVPVLAEYGFEFRLPEPGRMVVTAAPAFLPPAKLENLLRQVLSDAGDAGEALETAREKLLASLACRSSVLLGRTLPEEEMLSLLERFFSIGQMPTCPHGRPTAIRIGWDELARRFGR